MNGSREEIINNYKWSAPADSRRDRAQQCGSSRLRKSAREKLLLVEPRGKGGMGLSKVLGGAKELTKKGNSKGEWSDSPEA